MFKISLYILYYISITQKAHGATDVGVMWSNVVEKTGEPEKTH